eukprot:Lithocolla_globosa_v1_NODE_2332_length_2045_cov_3.522613.p3 type:complete len:115 gc:universal NODE_2332_length_2045_cov_3.522613:1505-1161(-)
METPTSQRFGRRQGSAHLREPCGHQLERTQGRFLLSFPRERPAPHPRARIQRHPVDGDNGTCLLWEFWLPSHKFFCCLKQIWNAGRTETINRRCAFHGTDGVFRRGPLPRLQKR